MKKIIFLLLVFYSSLCLAKFWEDEKLVRVLAIQTGYTLNGDEWIVGIGPLAYGFTDHFMVKTNFLHILASYINLECKYAIIMEKDSIPAIALRVAYVNALGAQSMADGAAERYKKDVESIKASLYAFSIWLGMSKRLSPKLVGHGSFNVAISECRWDVKTRPGKTDPTSKEREDLEKTVPTTNLIFGTEHEFSKKLRGLTNIGFNFTHQTPIIGAGIIWASTRTMRIELGLYYPLLPHISIYWRW